MALLMVVYMNLLRGYVLAVLIQSSLVMLKVVQTNSMISPLMEHLLLFLAK